MNVLKKKSRESISISHRVFLEVKMNLIIPIISRKALQIHLKNIYAPGINLQTTRKLTADWSIMCPLSLGRELAWEFVKDTSAELPRKMIIFY